MVTVEGNILASFNRWWLLNRPGLKHDELSRRDLAKIAFRAGWLQLIGIEREIVSDPQVQRQL